MVRTTAALEKLGDGVYRLRGKMELRLYIIKSSLVNWISAACWSAVFTPSEVHSVFFLLWRHPRPSLD